MDIVTLALAKKYADEKLTNGKVDLTGYAKEDYVDAEIEELNKKIVQETGKLSQEKVDQTYVDAEIEELNKKIVQETGKLSEEKVDQKELENYALKDEIPTVPVQSVNGKTGAVQLSASEVGALPNSTKIPANTSDLTNDSGFITNLVNNLANYYLKSETYTQEEINQKLSIIPKFSIKVVSSLPTSDINDTTVYLVKSGEDENNLYTEYIYVDGAWELLGKQSVDLSDYALKSDIPTALSALTNDAGFITKYVSDLENYYAKNDVYNKDEIDAKGYLTEHQDISGLASKATTLAGYGITDGVTNEQIEQFSGTVEITSDAPTKEQTVLTINPESETVNLYTAEEVDEKFNQLSEEIVNHKGDTDIHVTATEKETWNAKATTEYVDNKITDLKAQKSQLRVQIPEVNDTMENALAWLIENGDTSKMYVLPDGYIYAYTIGKEEVYTDVLKDIGYQENMRINSSGVIVEWTTSDADVTGYIPCKTGDIIGVKEMPIPSAYTSGAYWNQVAAYDSNKAYIAKSSLCLDDDYPDSYGHALDAVSEDGNIVQFTVKKSIFGENVAYIVINAKDITDESEVYVNSTIVSGYGWRNTGHAFVPADYEDRIVELEETTAEHEARLQTLEQYEIETIDVPTYWLEELETKADSIQQAMENAGRNKSAFLWYTDAHWDAGNSGNSPLLLNHLYKNTSMNKVFFGGDIIGDPTELTHDTVKHLYDEWRTYLKGLEHHSAIGNHDNIHKGRNDSAVSNIVYSFLLAPEEMSDMVMGDDFYYYIDNPCEKTRYLILDSGRYSLSDDETEFIIKTLTSVPNDWHVVVISHIWFQYTSATAPTVGSINAYMQKVLDLFDAYNARESGSVTMVSTAYSYDFTDAGGKVEFCIGGHIHVDYDISSTAGIPVILTASDVNQDRSSEEDEDSGTLGTITESAVYGIIADYTNNKVVVVGVGRGGSREITLT